MKHLIPKETAQKFIFFTALAFFIIGLLLVPICWAWQSHSDEPGVGIVAALFVVLGVMLAIISFLVMLAAVLYATKVDPK